MLTRDTKARFEKKLWRWRFYIGGEDMTGKVRWYGGWLGPPIGDVMRAQRDRPVRFASFKPKTGRERQYWVYRDDVYYTDGRFEDEDVSALILARYVKAERAVQRARTIVGIEASKNEPAREPIPDEVKMFVWTRDGGRCVTCGSNEQLEFDHIIPVSKGGSSTQRNLQLLCADCNRSKGGELF